jgi:hypothetical protein
MISLNVSVCRKCQLFRVMAYMFNIVSDLSYVCIAVSL